jgi:para-nitrobenzyl esterase
MPAEELMKKTSGFRGPVIDGYVLPEHIADIFEKDRANDVVLLTGWNQDEGIMFGPPKKADAFRKDVMQIFGEDAQKALEYYRAGTDEEAAKAQLDLSRDQVFGMPNYIWAGSQASKGKKVFVYRFNRKVPATGELTRYGAFHTGEVPYAYDNLKYGDRPYEEPDHAIAKLMSSYWVNFIRAGDPNGKGLPAWPPFSPGTKKVMVFDVKSGTETMEDAAQLELLYSKMRK